MKMSPIVKQSNIIYQETRALTVKFNHPKSDDYLGYTVTIQIRDSGKYPIEMSLKFTGILPFAAPMPPREHSIKAVSILDIYAKLTKWFKKFGYILIL